MHAGNYTQLEKSSVEMKREDVIREVESMLPTGGYQVAKSIVKLAEELPGTWRKIGKAGRKRPMIQAEAFRIVDLAKKKIELADLPDK
jgi:hypothetical protein